MSFSPIQAAAGRWAADKRKKYHSVFKRMSFADLVCFPWLLTSDEAQFFLWVETGQMSLISLALGFSIIPAAHWLSHKFVAEAPGKQISMVAVVIITCNRGEPLLNLWILTVMQPRPSVSLDFHLWKSAHSPTFWPCSWASRDRSWKMWLRSYPPIWSDHLGPCRVNSSESELMKVDIFPTWRESEKKKQCSMLG